MHRPSRRARSGSFSRSTFRQIDRAASSLGRWAITDHTGFSQAMIDMPQMGFWASLRYLLFQLVIRLGSAIIAGILFALMLAYGLPWLITFFFTFP
jgi:hypothetical protein